LHEWAGQLTVDGSRASAFEFNLPPATAMGLVGDAAAASDPSYGDIDGQDAPAGIDESGIREGGTGWLNGAAAASTSSPSSPRITQGSDETEGGNRAGSAPHSGFRGYGALAGLVGPFVGTVWSLGLWLAGVVVQGQGEGMNVNGGLTGREHGNDMPMAISMVGGWIPVLPLIGLGSRMIAAWLE